MTALVLGSSVSGGASSLEAQRAATNGFTVTVVDDATWAGMTAADFAAYQLVVIGDPSCSILPEVVSQNAEALADAVMARAGGNTKAGNRILLGTDPAYHSTQGGDKLINSGIDFAGGLAGATNLYLDLSCLDYDHDGDLAPDALTRLLPRLTLDSTPNWSENDAPPCGGEVSLIANQGAFATLTSADLQGWFCSDHMTFPTYPTDWAPLAVATDTPTSPTCGTDVSTGDAVCGEAYVLIAGAGITVTSPNLALSPLTATNPVGTPHTVTATVTSPAGAPLAGAAVTFLVTGANAGAAGTCSPTTCVSDSAGQVAFTYTGLSAGNDTINASVTLSDSTQTATAAKTWTTSGVKPTSTTYSGGSAVQYSDAVSLSGRLLDTSVSPAVAVAGKQLGFTLGTQSASAGPTDASGDASTPLVVTQLPGSVSSVATSFLGDSGYAASSDSDPFAVNKEDCTLTYSGDTLVGALANTNLAADLGELDTSLGDRSGKTVVFTVTGAGGGTQTFTGVTDAAGHAATSQPLVADVYAVSVAFAGDGYYLPCATSGETIVTVQAAGAKVTGGGWTSVASGRTSFGMNAIPQTDGTYKGQFQLRPKSGKDRFHGREVSGFTSSGNTATWTVTGSWNGVAGHRMTVTVVDNGSSGSKKGDTISLVVRTAGGSTVFTTSGTQALKGGNITVH